MKLKHKLFIFTLLLSSSVELIQAQTNDYIKNTFKSQKNTELKNLTNSISVCRWKFDSNSCLQFSFDDNLKTHNKISKIFDIYGYKTSFFVNALNVLVDSVIDMNARGHEIGNHTYDHSHPLTALDSTGVDFEVRKGKEGVENLLGKKCLDEADPWHSFSNATKKVLFNYELFGRDYTEYASYSVFGVETGMTISQFTTYFINGIKSKAMMPVAAHGLIGESYGQISEQMLKQVLDTVKIHADKGETWCTTTLEAEFYDNLIHEVSLKTTVLNDTLVLIVNNYKKNKYKDISSSPLSISIPNQANIQLTCLTEKVDIRKFTDRSVYTFDLQRDTTLVFKTKVSPDITTEVINDTLIQFYPNPVLNYLFLQFNGDISFVEVYDLQGNLVLLDNTKSDRINMALLKPGLYMLKVFAQQNGSSIIVRNKFLKI